MRAVEASERKDKIKQANKMRKLKYLVVAAEERLGRAQEIASDMGMAETYGFVGEALNSLEMITELLSDAQK